jgi:hypothetical protein
MRSPADLAFSSATIWGYESCNLTLYSWWQGVKCGPFQRLHTTRLYGLSLLDQWLTIGLGSYEQLH